MHRSRLFRLFVSFAVLLGVYGVYALAVVPVIEPTATPGTPGTNPVEVFHNSQQRFLSRFGTLFPDGSWELENSKLVELDQAIVLVKEYQPQADGRLKINPCTIIYYPQTASSDRPPRPIVMQAPDGALLEFDKPFDLAGANIGKLVGGLLKGDIEIWSPETEQGAGDRLEIHTHNVQLSRQRVWTPHDVDFRYGDSYGSGRDLVITLEDSAAPANSTGDTSPLGGVRSLELVHVDQVYIVPPEKPQPAEDNAENETAEPDELSPMQITCQGPFDLDLVEQVATFNEQVDVHRLHAEGPSDQLQCQQLSLHFRQGTVADPDTAQPGGGESGMQLSKIVARGRPVIGRGPSFDAEFRGELLEYDFDRQLIDLAGEGGITLHHGQRSIEAPHVQYQLAEEGKLGRAWAAGPGRIIVLDPETGQTQMAAWWKEDLRLRPHEGMHVISLYEEAQVSLGPSGRMSADEIHVWIREVPAEETGDGPADPASNGIVADRMMAQGDVRVESPQLVANNNRVELWIEDQSASGGDTPQSQPVPEGDLVPEGGLASTPAAEPERDQPPPERLEVSGNLLRALLVRRHDDWLVDNLTLDGDVRLAQRSTANLDQPPLRVAGTFLQMRGVSKTGGSVSVQGSPALVEAENIVTRGGTIELERESNRLWIEGPGRLDLPLDRKLSGQPSAATGRAEVTWQGGLDFNGQVFRFDDQIVITTQDQVAHCQRMEVVLDEAVDFSQPETDGEIQVRQVVLSGGVEMDGRTVENGRPISRDYMQLDRLTLDPLTGRLTGTGPGVVRSTRRGNAAALLPGGAQPPAGQPGGGQPPAEQQEGLTYLEVTFNQGITGNTIQRELEFFDRVITVYGPVDDWEQTLSSQADHVAAGVVALTCERLQVAEMGRTPQGRGWLELEARGNTLVEGQNFIARCMRMSYTQEKDLLVMEGDGRSSVQLWKLTDTGEESSASIRKLLYWRGIPRLEVVDAYSFDLNSQGISRPRR